MTRAGLCVIAIGIATGGAAAQSVEFRLIERFDDTFIGPGDSGPTGSPTTPGNAFDQTLWFVVQARVTGLNPQAFNGLGGFTGSVRVTADGGSGSFKASGVARLGGSPTNNSPVNFFPPGTSANGFETIGAAHYAPFRLVANLGAGGNGSRVTPESDELVNIFGATGGAALERLSSGEVTAAAWGVDTWINIYSFQYDVLTQGFQSLVFSTDFLASYFTSQDAQGIPNSLNFSGHTQGTYSIFIPSPGTASVVGLWALVALRRRRN